MRLPGAGFTCGGTNSPQRLLPLIQTPHSGYVTLCYFNHCQHKNHVTMVYHVIDSKLQPFKTTAIIQNHVTIVRPCDRSNLNTYDSGAELAE